MPTEPFWSHVCSNCGKEFTDGHITTSRCSKCRRPICCHCRKSIKGKIYYQGDQLTHPSHKKCLIVIKKSKDGGI